MPASIFEKSRMSLSTPSMESAEVLTRVKYSRCCGVSSVTSVSSVMPIMPFMGVRISWLMLARNSDLSREPSTAASRATTRSANDRRLFSHSSDVKTAVATTGSAWATTDRSFRP